jgi:hypothetical protein
MVYFRNRISKVKNVGTLEYLCYFFTQLSKLQAYFYKLFIDDFTSWVKIPLNHHGKITLPRLSTLKFNIERRKWSWRRYFFFLFKNLKTPPQANRLQSLTSTLKRQVNPSFGTIHVRRRQIFHDFWPPPPYRRQFFTTIRRQIWQIFDPSPSKKHRRLKWMVSLLFYQTSVEKVRLQKTNE